MRGIGSYTGKKEGTTILKVLTHLIKENLRYARNKITPKRCLEKH